MLAVRLLEATGLVHRAIGPDTVHWDGRHVRLAEPYAALRAGEPREAYGAAPWASPEQRRGTGAADPRDDLWSVAQLVYFLAAGRPTGARARPPTWRTSGGSPRSTGAAPSPRWPPGAPPRPN